MITLEHVGKSYGGDPPILSDVSLALEPGGFYFITGASGAGKTTLLRIIYLAERPSRGRVVVLGGDAVELDRARRAALRRQIGVVFQEARLFDELSAHENVALPLRLAGGDERQIGENVAELLDWIGLAERGEPPAGALSGGLRQRIAIARAIVGRPALLIADEPTGNLDDDIAMLLVRIFERINRLGTTVLIATHDIAFARQFEHRRLHLADGVLTPDGAAR